MGGDDGMGGSTAPIAWELKTGGSPTTWWSRTKSRSRGRGVVQYCVNGKTRKSSSPRGSMSKTAIWPLPAGLCSFATQSKAVQSLL